MFRNPVKPIQWPHGIPLTHLLNPSDPLKAPLIPLGSLNMPLDPIGPIRNVMIVIIVIHHMMFTILSFCQTSAQFTPGLVII